MSRTNSFLVRLTADFFEDDSFKYQGVGLREFEDYPSITDDYFPQHCEDISPEQIAGAQGIIVLTPSVTTLAGASDTLAIGRFGVGYDALDVPACIDADVAVFIAA